MNIEDIRQLHSQMIKTKSELGTSASHIVDQNLHEEQNVVKVITKESLEKSDFPEALSFLRKSINTSKNVYHHLGIYCYQLETLKNFVSLRQSQNEIKNRLEQLRALDNNIKVNVSLAKEAPIGVDTKEDFMAIKKIMEYKS
jgi:3-deoxy-manno-octulosonate cytidylyltransferase (CMP-KDO synthetase)